MPSGSRGGEGQREVVDAQLGEGADLRGGVRRRTVDREERLGAGIELEPGAGGEAWHRAAGCVGGGPDDRDPRRVDGGLVAEAWYASASAAHAPEGPFLPGAQPDRHVAALGRQRLEHVVLEVVEAAVERRRAAPDQRCRQTAMVSSR